MSGFEARKKEVKRGSAVKLDPRTNEELFRLCCYVPISDRNNLRAICGKYDLLMMHVVADAVADITRRLIEADKNGTIEKEFDLEKYKQIRD